jgi:triosephosphate isomerase (TIM)
MRRKLIAGNWKMHGRLAQVHEWVAASRAAAIAHPGVDVLVCPPFPYLLPAIEGAAGSPLKVGAQDCAGAEAGAYTGAVAAPMLADCGAGHCLVGHSERRQLFGDTDAVVAAKVQRAQAAGLVPVLCVGETLVERDAGRTREVVLAQLDAVFALGAAVLERLVIAYEPVWAIGTGRTASASQAQEVHGWIRSHVQGLDAKISGSVRILYGGSVKAANAAELLRQPDIDGALVGGASLDPREFAAIVAAAA